VKNVLSVKNGRWTRHGIFAGVVLVTMMAFGGLSVTVAWTPNPEPDIAGYKVYVGTNAGRYSTVLDAGKGTNQMITNLAAGWTYYFAVTAYNTSGLESDLSSEVSYTAPVPSPELIFTPLGNGSFNLQFEGVPGVAYWIEYTTNLTSTTWQRLTTLTANSQGLAQLTDTPADGRRFYRAVFPSSQTNQLWLAPLRLDALTGVRVE
jgi:hypothetical protein